MQATGKAEKRAEMVSALAEIYGKPLSSYAIKAYVKALMKYDLDVLEKAFDLWLSTPDKFRGFPLPKDIIAMIDGYLDEKASKAWEDLMYAVRKYGAYANVTTRNEVLYRTVIDLYGSWVDLCSMEEDKLNMTRRMFIETYMVNLRIYSEKSDKPLAFYGLSWKGTDGGRLGKIPDHLIVSLEGIEEDRIALMEGRVKSLERKMGFTPISSDDEGEEDGIVGEKLGDVIKKALKGIKKKEEKDGE